MRQKVEDGEISQEEFNATVKARAEKYDANPNMQDIAHFWNKASKSEAPGKADPKVAERAAQPKGGDLKVGKDSTSMDTEDLLATLHPEERKAVDRYISIAGGYLDKANSEDYDVFNDAMRSGKKPTAEVKTLDKVIERSVVSEDITNHRAVQNEFGVKLAKMPVGGSFTDKGYTSVAGTKDAAEAFDDPNDTVPVMQFIVPKGGKALAIGGDEHELLVARGATWVKTGPNEFTLKI